MHVTRAQAKARKSVFPFLKLSAELRNEIYTLALGGRVIHVGTQILDRDHKVITCSVSPNEAGTHNASPNPDGRALLDSSFHRHGRCTKRLAENLSIPLISTRKVIHEECKNFPFSDNTFAFCDLPGLNAFIERIGKDRASNIGHILLYSATNLRPWTWSATDLSDTPFRRLDAVHIYIELSLNDIEADSTSSWKTNIEFTEPMDQDAVFRGLQGLQKFRPRLVSVTIESLEERSPAHPARAVLATWATRVGHMILGSADSTRVEVFGDKARFTVKIAQQDR